MPSQPETLPAPTSDETVDKIVAESARPKDFPIRYGFVQTKDRDGGGPLADLVRSRDKRALLLYLLTITKASSNPWEVTLPATVWARALDLPPTATAKTTVSKAWRRLDTSLNLVRRRREHQSMAIELLREDGSSIPYVRPDGSGGDTYFRVPLSLWTHQAPTGSRWYRELTLPELAVLLIGLSLGDKFWLPREYGPQWYSLSPATIARGLDGLESHGLLKVQKRWVEAPLTPTGYIRDHRYTLQQPFGPIGYESGSAARKKAVSNTAPLEI